MGKRRKWLEQRKTKGNLAQRVSFVNAAFVFKYKIGT